MVKNRGRQEREDEKCRNGVWREAPYAVEGQSDRKRKKIEGVFRVGATSESRSFDTHQRENGA